MPENKVEFGIVEQKNGQWMVTDSQTPMPNAKSLVANFDPAKGTVKGAVAHCKICGTPVDGNTTRRLFQEGKASQRMVAVVLHHPNKKGKTYRIATKKDLDVFKEAEKYLEEKRVKLSEEWGIDPMPDEIIHNPTGKEYNGFLLYNFTPVVLYGMTKWGDLFNNRQKLALITFAEKVRIVYKMMIKEGYEDEYAKAVVSYLVFIINSLVDHNSMSCQWRGGTEDGSHTFGRQALPMNWDYFEVNPLSGSTGSFESSLPKLLRVVEHCSYIRGL